MATDNEIRNAVIHYLQMTPFKRLDLLKEIGVWADENTKLPDSLGIVREQGKIDEFVAAVDKAVKPTKPPYEEPDWRDKGYGVSGMSSYDMSHDETFVAKVRLDMTYGKGPNYIRLYPYTEPTDNEVFLRGFDAAVAAASSSGLMNNLMRESFLAHMAAIREEHEE